MYLTDREYLEMLGKAIATRRKALGFSQLDLSGIIGMEVPNLSVIENGKSNPQLLTLLRIASALDCNLADLLPNLSRPTLFLEQASEYIPRKHSAATKAKSAKPKQKGQQTKRKK